MHKLVAMLFMIKLYARIKVLHEYFSRFLNCTNDAKSNKAPQIHFAV